MIGRVSTWRSATRKNRSGDALAIYMPMNVEAVTIYLAIIRAGCVAVSIADSLAPREIATRLQLSSALGIITQDVALRGGRRLALYAKIVEAVRTVAGNKDNGGRGA